MRRDCRTLVLILLLLALTGSQLWAQSELDLKRYFEGKAIVVGLDMPGDKSGVDIRLDGDPRVDYSEVGRRLKTYGTSLRDGDRVLVTLIKVNKKNIEVQLAGGGYGTFGDSTGVSTPSTYVPKTAREKRLEDEVKKATDPKTKKLLREELDDLRREREREESRLEMQAAQAKIMAEARERQLRESSGSRFNIWYSGGVPVESLRPEAIVEALSGLAEFPWLSSDAGDRRRDSDFRTSDDHPVTRRIRKGLTEDEVTRIYGDPIRRMNRQLEDLRIVNATYADRDGDVQVMFVEGVVVKYSISSN